jgi:hypothetical protein
MSIPRSKNKYSFGRLLEGVNCLWTAGPVVHEPVHVSQYNQGVPVRALQVAMGDHRYLHVAVGMWRSVSVRSIMEGISVRS